MILSLCSKPELLELMLIVKRILAIIKIVVPILAVIFISVDTLKAVTAGKQDDISKKLKAIPKRLMAVVLVFLIPFLVETMISVIDEDVEFAACFENATKENISLAYSQQAEDAVALAEVKLTRIDHDNAVAAIKKLQNNVQKKVLEDRLAIVLEKVREIEANNKPDWPDKPSNPGTPSTPNPGASGMATPYTQLSSGAYGSLSFCTASNSVEMCGCGPVSFAMIASGLVNGSYNPKVVTSYLCSLGHTGCGMAESEMLPGNDVGNAMLSRFGLTSKSIISKVSNNSSSSSVMAAKDAIKSSLRSGKPVILHIPGHYVVLSEITSDNKIYLINSADVKSYNLSTGYYTIDEIWNKTHNYKNRCTDNGNCGWSGAIEFSKR